MQAPSYPRRLIGAARRSMSHTAPRESWRAGAPMDRGAPNGAMQVSAPGERARIYPCRKRTTPSPSPLRPSPLGRGCPDCIGTGEGSRGYRAPAARDTYIARIAG
jgi:hypothetical protein